MNSKGLVLLTIAVVAIGILGLPSTVSLFSGQHAWYNVSAKGNDVPCEKCHADIADEMSHTEPHVDMECWYCHRTGNLTGYTYASGDGGGAIAGQEAHAASTVECMDCHKGFGVECMDCHWGPPPWGGGKHPIEWRNENCGNCHVLIPQSKHPVWGKKLEAGGFNLTINLSDTGSAAAHKAFVDDAINSSDLMEGANEACIACHTAIPVKINWTHAYSLEFNATYKSEWVLPPTHFNTSNYTANGTVTVTSYGNWSGGANTSGWPEGNVTIWGS
jgi:hypothetical protein